MDVLMVLVEVIMQVVFVVIMECGNKVNVMDLELNMMNKVEKDMKEFGLMITGQFIKI